MLLEMQPDIQALCSVTSWIESDHEETAMYWDVVEVRAVENTGSGLALLHFSFESICPPFKA